METHLEVTTHRMLVLESGTEMYTCIPCLSTQLSRFCERQAFPPVILIACKSTALVILEVKNSTHHSLFSFAHNFFDPSKSYLWISFQLLGLFVSKWREKNPLCLADGVSNRDWIPQLFTLPTHVKQSVYAVHADVTTATHTHTRLLVCSKYLGKRWINVFFLYVTASSHKLVSWTWRWVHCPQMVINYQGTVVEWHCWYITNWFAKIKVKLSFLVVMTLHVWA